MFRKINNFNNNFQSKSHQYKAFLYSSWISAAFWYFAPFTTPFWMERPWQLLLVHKNQTGLMGGITKYIFKKLVSILFVFWLALTWSGVDGAYMILSKYHASVEHASPMTSNINTMILSKIFTVPCNNKKQKIHKHFSLCSESDILFYFFIYSPYFSWLRVCVTHKACIQQPEHLLPLSDSLSTAFSRSTKTPGKGVTRIQTR